MLPFHFRGLLLLLLLLLLQIVIEFSLGGSIPYTSTDKTNKNKYTETKYKKHSINNENYSKYKYKYYQNTHTYAHPSDYKTSLKYYECVSGDLVTQHEIRMRRVILLSVACLVVPHYLFNSMIFGEKLLNAKRVF